MLEASWSKSIRIVLLLLCSASLASAEGSECVFLHLGDTNPESTGWTRMGNLVGISVADDGGLAAWNVADRP